MTILFFSDISWHGLFQRPQHLARGIAKHWPVVWIEPATLLEKIYMVPREVEPGISVISLPVIPYNARKKPIRSAARFMASLPLVPDLVSAGQFGILKNALADTDHEFGMIIHNVQSIALASRIKPRWIIYDYIDNIFGFTEVPKLARRQWERCVREADMVTVTSPVLERHLRPLRPGPIEYVGNGAEVDFFANTASLARPDDMPSGKPIVGYVGAVYPWLDYGLIGDAARAMPDVDFVLVGRTHPDVARILDGLRSMSNIHILGFKPYEQVPAYLKYMDVGIIPFALNDLTAAVNPVKVYEYSAAGKPTVATDFSEDIRRCSDVVTLVRSAADMVPALRAALAASSDRSFQDRLRAFARQNDWSAKISQFIELMQRCSAHRR